MTLHYKIIASSAHQHVAWYDGDEMWRQNVITYDKTIKNRENVTIT